MSSDAFAPVSEAIDPGPLGPLPRLSARRLRLERGLLGDRADAIEHKALSWLAGTLGDAIEPGTPEVLDRPSGLGKPGLVAGLSWPARGATLGLGIETPLVHALVDRLLGFERRPGEERLPVTPVERGLIAYVLARSLADAQAEAPPELILDRVGPEAFAVEGLGPVVTLRWPVRIGATIASVRLWLPEGLVGAGAAPTGRPADEGRELLRRHASLGSEWRAFAGSVTLSRGPGWLRVGGVLTLDGAPLKGTVASPTGPVELRLSEPSARCVLAGEAAPDSGGGRIVLTAPFRREVTPREPIPVSLDDTTPSPTEVPVTLAVELGRVNLPLHRLADLKPGDVIELGRHAREPVELTSNGRLVARGELVQIDTELGVRVTSVFL